MKKIFLALFLILLLTSCAKEQQTSAPGNESSVSLLFIGNSHTYYNDMPLILRSDAEADGVNCEIAVIAHSGYYLYQHLEEPEAALNIKTGQYDYVILQGHANPFDPMSFYTAATSFNDLIKDAGSKTILFEPWVMEMASATQEDLHAVYNDAAESLGALLAPVGMAWKEQNRESDLIPDLYDFDRTHASMMGSELAARILWETIKADMTSSRSPTGE